jgi:hypothetical protein
MNATLPRNAERYPQDGGKSCWSLLASFLQMACNHWSVQVSCGYPHHPAARLRRLFCACPASLGLYSTSPMTVNREQAMDALARLLEVFAGPNYSGALREGDLTTRLERCTGWVKAEASEAASLIESCVPHGKPMLAQAQQRLAALQSLKTLQAVAIQHFGPLDDPC